jgi:CheY-like chemotaxis protein
MLELPLWLQPTVLVIDDNEGLPDLFQRYLQGTPWQVLAAATAEEGLRLAHERHPHAIVLDILMPGTDGWSVLQELKANPATAHIPVLVCSVFSDPELARAQGAAAFIPKPVSRQALLQALAAHAPR